LTKVSAIIPAAGLGSRFGEEKQFKILGDKPLWFHALYPFTILEDIDEIIIIVNNNMIDSVTSSNYYKSLLNNKQIKVVPGGEERKRSVLNGIDSAKKENKLVCIHDAARPFVKSSLINQTIQACYKYDGAILAIPTFDTMKIIKNGFIDKTINRESIWRAQTPQTFKKSKLLNACKKYINQNINDESTLMEKCGYKIKVIKGEQQNFKITTKYDWEIAKMNIKKA